MCSLFFLFFIGPTKVIHSQLSKNFNLTYDLTCNLEDQYSITETIDQVISQLGYFFLSALRTRTQLFVFLSLVGYPVSVATMYDFDIIVWCYLRGFIPQVVIVFGINCYIEDMKWWFKLWVCGALNMWWMMKYMYIEMCIVLWAMNCAITQL